MTHPERLNNHYIPIHFKQVMEIKTNPTECLSRRVLADQLTILYAEAVRDNVQKIAKYFCYGCRTGHLSQTKHSCIQLLPEQKLELYFDIAIRVLSDQEVIHEWHEDRLDVLPLYRNCTNCRKKLFQTVWRLVGTEKE